MKNIQLIASLHFCLIFAPNCSMPAQERSSISMTSLHSQQSQSRISRSQSNSSIGPGAAQIQAPAQNRSCKQLCDKHGCTIINFAVFGLFILGALVVAFTHTNPAACAISQQQYFFNESQDVQDIYFDIEASCGNCNVSNSCNCPDNGIQKFGDLQTHISKSLQPACSTSVKTYIKPNIKSQSRTNCLNATISLAQLKNQLKDCDPSLKSGEKFHRLKTFARIKHKKF